MRLSASAPYRFVPFRQQDAQEIARWKYAGEYAFYNQALGRLVAAATLRPLYTLMGLDLFSVLDAAEELVGLFTFTRHGRTIEVGLQMRPDRTGHGEGLGFMQAGLAFARERYHPRTFLLYVAEFNQRAITVYERAGFRKVRRQRRAGEGGRVWHWEMTRLA